MRPSIDDAYLDIRVSTYRFHNDNFPADTKDQIFDLSVAVYAALNKMNHGKAPLRLAIVSHGEVIVVKSVRGHSYVKVRVVDRGAHGGAGRGRVGTGGPRGPRIGRSWSRGSGSGGRYALTDGWGVHAGEGRGAGFGVKLGNLLSVGLVFGRGGGVSRPCPEL